MDPGPHGTGRHMEHMLPEIAREDFRKGAQVKTSLSLLESYCCSLFVVFFFCGVFFFWAQWFTMKRQHTVIVMADSLYYSKFREYLE